MIHSLSVVVVSGQMLVLHNILSVSAPDLFGVLDESIFVVFSSVLRIRCILIRIRIRFVETRILFRIRPKIEKISTFYHFFFLLITLKMIDCSKNRDEDPTFFHESGFGTAGKKPGSDLK